MRVKLTDRFVKSATTEGCKSPIFMDDEVIGSRSAKPQDFYALLQFYTTVPVTIGKA